VKGFTRKMLKMIKNTQHTPPLMPNAVASDVPVTAMAACQPLSPLGLCFSAKQDNRVRGVINRSSAESELVGSSTAAAAAAHLRASVL
jgi:hypothetical protein